ncbi:hypothetical protein HDE_10605 [Halotydeus destructor]|nr:hypothetical protein HDE_10605 [Halotydeus destructor]
MSSMSPFFKPQPRRSACYVSYKNFLYISLASLLIVSAISTPWLLDVSRLIFNDNTVPGQRMPTDTWIYATIAVMHILIACVIFIGIFAIYSESYRFCMSYGICSLFSPLVVANYRSFMYAKVVIVLQLVFGFLFCIYAIMVIKFEAKAKKRMNAMSRRKQFILP